MNRQYVFILLGLLSENVITSPNEIITLTADYINKTILPSGSIILEILNQTQDKVNDVEASMKGNFFRIIFLNDLLKFLSQFRELKTLENFIMGSLVLLFSTLGDTEPFVPTELPQMNAYCFLHNIVRAHSPTAKPRHNPVTLLVMVCPFCSVRVD